MSKKDKKPGEPIECCVYCETDVVCCWTVMIGPCGYPMCKDCSGEASKDFFSYCMRKDSDRIKPEPPSEETGE